MKIHNLWNGKEYPKTVSYLYSSESQKLNFQELASILPWIWKISPNVIETAYLNWIKEVPRGIHLITWPDEHVRFLPLLINEYTSAFPEKRIKILYREKSDEVKDLDRFSYPSVKLKYENLLSIKNPQIVQQELFRDIQKYGKDKYLLERKKTEVFIRYESGKIISKHYEYGSSFVNIRKKAILEIESCFGINALKKIEDIKKKNSEKTIVNNSGFIILTITETEPDYGPGINQFKPLEIWNYIVNYSKFQRTTNNNYVSFIHLDNDLIKNPASLLEHSGDLLIVEDSDYLIQDRRYHGTLNQYLYTILESGKFKTVLLFSSFREKRHIYRLMDDNGFFGSLPVIYHTIDNKEISSRLSDQIPDHICIFSGISQEKESNESTFIPEFIIIPELSELRELYSELSEKSNIKAKSVLKFHESRIIRTLLDLTPYTLHTPFFSPYYRIKNEHIPVESIFEILTDEFGIDSPESEQYKIMIRKIFGKSLCENPIRKKIEFLISDLKIQKCQISILVPFEDYFDCIQLINSGRWSEISDMEIKIGTWNNFELNRKSDQKQAIISLVHPSLNFKYSSCNFDKLIFIGESGNLNSIQEIIDSRVNDQITRPLIKPDNINAIPELLANIINQISDSAFYQPEFGKQDQIISQSNDRESFQLEGKNRIRCYLSDGSTYVVPGGYPIIVRNNDWFEEITADINSLLGKELLFKRNQLIQSFRKIFTEFMIENAHWKLFSSSGEWNNFLVMYNEARTWNHLLETTISRYAQEKQIGFSEAETIVADKLSLSGLTAESSDYIPNWWTRIDTIETSTGEEISIFRTERPKNVQDMRKIFQVIEDMCPGISDGINPDRVYYASRNLQNMRARFMKEEWLPGPENKIFHKIKDEIQLILSVSESSEVINAEMISN